MYFIHSSAPPAAQSINCVVEHAGMFCTVHPEINESAMTDTLSLISLNFA